MHLVGNLMAGWTHWEFSQRMIRGRELEAPNVRGKSSRCGHPDDDSRNNATWHCAFAVVY